MLALCLMLLVTYYALNYTGIIGLGLQNVRSCILAIPYAGNHVYTLGHTHLQLLNNMHDLVIRMDSKLSKLGLILIIPS